MKKLTLAVLLSVFILPGSLLKAQVNLPYTLSFNYDASHWNSSTWQDGYGGTKKINNLTIQIYTASADHSTLFPGSTIFWTDNEWYYSSDGNYNGITSGPDSYTTNNGAHGMVIKTTDNTKNFSLKSIQLYDWGYTNDITIETYNNGSRIGSVIFTPDASYFPTTITQANLLDQNIFGNVDEIRFYPTDPGNVFNLSMNNISLDVPSIILPVTFTSIAASQSKSGIEVIWKTAIENQISSYEIQRSADGKTFSAIGNQLANGIGISNTYSWTDQNPVAGNNFYRIKSIGKSGDIQFSKIAKINQNNSNKSLIVYPNPTTNGFLHLRMNHFSEGSYGLRVISQSGQVVTIKNIQHNSGEDQVINLANVQNGVYLLQLVHPDQSISECKVLIKK